MTTNLPLKTFTTDGGTRYTFTRALGRGGFGTTSLAVPEGGGAEVVIKVLESDVDDHRERFIQEYDTLRSLRSDRIVRVLDAAFRPGEPFFIVMEYVAGRTLGERMAEATATQTPLPRSLARAISLNLLRALGDCHAPGNGTGVPIIHRDVTPSNVMLVRETTPIEIKLIDFGLCRPGARKHSVTGQTMGTPSYFPPEAFGGSPDDHGPASDGFSAGIVIRDLLAAGTGAETLDPAWFQAALKPGYDPRSRLEGLPGVPEGVVSVLAKALAADPQDRYADANEMCHALEAAWPDMSPKTLADQLAQTLWELLEEDRSREAQPGASAEAMKRLREAMQHAKVALPGVQQNSGEVRRRLGLVIEVLQVMEERNTAVIVPIRPELRAEFEKILGEMCTALPEQEFLRAEEELLRDVREGDTENFGFQCDAIRLQMKVFRRRQVAAVSPQWIIAHREAKEQAVQRARDGRRAPHADVQSWYEEWSRRLSSWELEFRAESREFSRFSAVVSRLQQDRITEKKDDAWSDQKLVDEIEISVKAPPSEEMKKLFRAYIRRVHPDHARTPQEEEARMALAKMLIEAYDQRDFIALKDAIFAIEMAEREGDDLDDEAVFQFAVKSLRKMLGSSLKILEEREKAQSHPLYALWVRARAMPGVDPVEVVRRYIQGTQETAAR